MPVMQKPETSQGCTTTSIEGSVERAPLPNPANKPYLMEKANYAARFPRLSIRDMKSGDSSVFELKQLVMSGLIRADEYRRDFFWDYKSEVCFDMASLPPTPFLSTSWISNEQNPDPSRRHTLFPFPKGSVKGLLRRPDVIIVKSRNTRWPGQAGPDHQGVMHPDNLERVVEVKFPGDVLPIDQEEAYIDIAGSSSRFSVLKVTDCRDEDDRERDREYNSELNPTLDFDPLRWPSLLPSDGKKPRAAPLPVPAYGPTPTERAAYVESWTQQVQTAIDGLLEQGAQGIRSLSDEVQQHLESAITWLSQKGDWVRQESQKSWEWVSETGVQVIEWTDEHLRSVWGQIQQYTDLTIDNLNRLEWIQILIDLGLAAATVVIVFAVGAALVTAGIPATIVAGLLVIVRLAQVSWALLASIIGGAAIASTANAG